MILDNKNENHKVYEWLTLDYQVF